MIPTVRSIAIFSTAAYILAVTAGFALHSHVHVHLGGAHFHSHANQHSLANAEDSSRANSASGGCSHDHAAHEHADHDHSHDSCATTCATDQSSEPSDCPSGPCPGSHCPSEHGEHDCVVCQFLAQAPLPVALVAMETSGERVEPCPLLTQEAPFLLVALPWQGRAPPRV